MRLSTQIKQFFKSKGIAIRVKTSTHFISCFIERDKQSLVFPLEYRREMLKIIYGNDCNFAENGNAGNIRPTNLAMLGNEWEKFLANRSVAMA